MSDRFSCPICLDAVAATRVAACGHMYCAGCYYDMLMHSEVAACAVCRRRLGGLPYPNYEVDSLLAAEHTADPAFLERVQNSKRRATAVEDGRDESDFLGIITSLQHADTAARTKALTDLLSALEASHRWTCASLGAPVLHALARCAGDGASTEDELAAAWRVLAHAATHFCDAGRLIGFGVHVSAAEALVSPVASVQSRRATTRAVSALVPFHASFFAPFLEPDWLERLVPVAPAAVACVALHHSSGLETLAEAGVLGTLLPQLAVHGRVLARDFLNAALARPSCASQLRHAAAIMLVRPLPHAAALAEIVARDSDAADIIAIAHADDVLTAVQAAQASEDFDAQLSVLELLHALHDKSAVRDANLVREVYAWMHSNQVPDSIVDFGRSYVGSCVRECAACAAAVADSLGRFDTAETLDSEALYMLGDVCSHEAVVEARSGELARLLPSLRFGTHAEVYLAMSLAGTPAGRALVVEHALRALRVRLEDMDEPTAVTAEDVITLCCGTNQSAPPPCF